MSAPEAPAEAVFHLNLEFEGRRRSVSARVPKRSLPVDALLPILHDVESALLDMAVDVVQEQGKAISCRAGCGACCRQLVPVSHSEARALAALVASMPAERQAQVRRRFRQTLEELDRRGLLEPLRNMRGDEPEPEITAFAQEYFRQQLPCPFLEDESCSIHPDRPLACREYLVTSPAEHCREPKEDTVAMVRIPAPLSEVLYRFEDGRGESGRRTVPLVLALELAEQQAADPPPRYSAPHVFHNFLSKTTDSMRRTAREAP